MRERSLQEFSEIVRRQAEERYAREDEELARFTAEFSSFRDRLPLATNEFLVNHLGDWDSSSDPRMMEQILLRREAIKTELLRRLGGTNA